MKKKLVLTAFLVIFLIISVCIFYHRPLQSAKIMITSDIHYLSDKLHDDDLAYQHMLSNSDGRLTQYCDVILSAFIEEVLQQKPDVLIISGDLSFNGEKLSHQDLAAKLHVLYENNIPVLVLAGNHDINSTRAASFFENRYDVAENINQQEFVSIYNDYGFLQAESRDSSSLSYMYKVNDNLYIIMIDSNGYGQNYLQQESYNWLEQQLEYVKKQNAKAITVTHQNIYAQNELLVFGYQLYDGDKLKDLLTKYKVTLNLSGHVHMQHYIKDKLTEIASSSLLMPPLQYGILEFDGGYDYYTKQIDFNSYCDNHDIDDDTIRNLNLYAKDYFINHSYKRGLLRLEEIGCDQATKEIIANVFAQYNYYYFSGEPFDYHEYENDAQVAKELAGYVGKYIEIITNESEIDFTKLKIKR